MAEYEQEKRALNVLDGMLLTLGLLEMGKSGDLDGAAQRLDEFEQILEQAEPRRGDGGPDDRIIKQAAAKLDRLRQEWNAANDRAG